MSAPINRDMTPHEIRVAGRAWYERQMLVLEKAHGTWWPANREWISEHLRDQLRERLEDLGWR